MAINTKFVSSLQFFCYFNAYNLVLEGHTLVLIQM